jgi:hypothetical protein
MSAIGSAQSSTEGRGDPPLKHQGTEGRGMSRSAVDQLLYMMDQAFEGDPSGRGQWHALLVNLASLREEDWTWLPLDGRRTIFSLVEEVGGCKYVYASQAFGDRSIHWKEPGSLPTLAADTPRDEVVAWLRGAHKHFRGCVEDLQDDNELLKLRLSPQGWERETRWIIKTMIEHDLYHSGEINHIRALAQKNDDGNE